MSAQDAYYPQFAQDLAERPLPHRYPPPVNQHRVAVRGPARKAGTAVGGQWPRACCMLRRGRKGSERVIVLLSDGQPTPASVEQTMRLGRLAKQMGVTVFAIGLGADADGKLLAQLSSGEGYYYFAPGPSDLADIYRRIAVNLPCR